jgi:hypothetical protein
MSDLRKAAEMALDAMVSFSIGTNKMFEGEFTEEIQALRQALDNFVVPPDVSNVVLTAVLAEREACAKVCEEIAEEFPFEIHEPDPVLPAYCAEAIRARGEK